MLEIRLDQNPTKYNPSHHETEEKTEEKNEQGGFVAVLHSLEKQSYGADGPFDKKGRVFMYIRHCLLRNWTQKQGVSLRDIAAATGLTHQTAQRAVSALEKEEHIIGYRSFSMNPKGKKIWKTTEYTLHPKRYGNDYIYRKNGQPFGVIEGGKQEGGGPNQEQLRTHPVQDPPEIRTPPVREPAQPRTLSRVKSAELQENLHPKNPLKEPIKELSPEKGDENGQMNPGTGGGDSTEGMVQQVIRKYGEAESKTIRKIWAELESSQTDDHGKPIASSSALLALMMKCYMTLKLNRANPYEKSNTPDHPDVAAARRKIEAERG